ncbi:MAG: hypothetical protein L0Y66_16315, partial [Myxococcaceae bacterium]|nr:hypothetical protein [Myxococcaceae bacterium]
MRLPLLAVLLTPVVAAAQTIQITYPTTTATARTLTVGPARCEGIVMVNYQATGQLCSDLELWVTTASNCSAGPQKTDHVFASLTPQQVATTPSGTQQFDLIDLPAFGADAGSSCGTPGVTETFQVCA